LVFFSAGKLNFIRIIVSTIQAKAFWVNDTHWVDYDPTVSDSPPSKKKRKEEPRGHKSGCARTEGYYKLDSKEKAKHKSHFARSVAEDSRAVESNMVHFIIYICLLENLINSFLFV